jgi:hypothetical protein
MRQLRGVLLHAGHGHQIREVPRGRIGVALAIGRQHDWKDSIDADHVAGPKRVLSRDARWQSLLADNFATLMEWRADGALPPANPFGFPANDVDFLIAVERVLTGGCTGSVRGDTDALSPSRAVARTAIRSVP